jgi:NAD(P)-dependent dehydrogenase (short-subunit alcohol dehydrogenase family)
MDREAQVGSHGHSDQAPVVLIPGGGGGLGQAVVQYFVASGAQVHVPALASEDVESLEGRCATGPGTLHIHRVGDLAEPPSVDALFRAVPAPHVLLHLAGGFSMAPVDETDPADWDRMMRMNATSFFLVARKAFAGMKMLGWGRILAVSALPALHHGAASMSAYAASKAAVLNLTQTLAREGAPHAITANAILPSIMDTPGNRAAMPDADRASWILPEEVAAVLSFLASPAGAVVTGAAVPLTRTP